MSEIMEVAGNSNGTGIKLTPQQPRARRARSITLALGAFVLVIFTITIVRLGSGAFTGPDYMRSVERTK